MQMIFESDAFTVVHVNANDPDPTTPPRQTPRPTTPRHGFEIVDKRYNKELYLDGLWAAAFQRQISTWQAATPTVDEVNEVLASYCELAQLPLVMH